MKLPIIFYNCIKTRLHAFNSHVSTGTNHCINKAILMLLMQRLGRDFFCILRGGNSAPVQMVFGDFFSKFLLCFEDWDFHSVNTHTRARCQISFVTQTPVLS